MNVNILFKRLADAAVIPQYQTKGSAGADLCAAEERTVASGEVALIRLGFAVAIPEGYELQIRPRSGLALRGITILNSPGTIDSDFRGELKVILANMSESDFKISLGDRVAQAVLSEVPIANFYEVAELGDTERGEDGFGSTG